MKIIQINATYGFASTGAIVKDIEREAKLNNISVGIAYQFAENEPELGKKIGGVIDWKIHAIATRLCGKQAYFSRRATAGLIKWLDAQAPDIVHLHNLHSNFINLNMLLDYLAERDIATVLTLHDCWFFTGKCFHFVESGCERWQSGCGECPRNKLDIKSLFVDATSKVFEDKRAKFSGIPRLFSVGCSRWISDLAKKSLLSCGDVRHIYNGIDTAIFSPLKTDFKTQHNINDSFVIVGAANKWLSEENANLLDSYIKNRKDGDVLVLFGANESAKRRINGMPGVIALDYVSEPRQMAEIFSAADVFVNPTHADTLPTVNMEAAACGTPVITYDVCGSPELVVDSETGYVVAEGDVSQMLLAIDKVRRGDISRDKCRAHALECFDKNENYKKYIDLYREIEKKGEKIC